MPKYYVVRKDHKIIVAELDQQGALHLHNEGCELGQRPYETRAEAEQERQRWQKHLDALIEPAEKLLNKK